MGVILLMVWGKPHLSDEWPALSVQLPGTTGHVVKIFLIPKESLTDVSAHYVMLEVLI